MEKIEYFVYLVAKIGVDTAENEPSKNPTRRCRFMMWRITVTAYLEPRVRIEDVARDPLDGVVERKHVDALTIRNVAACADGDDVTETNLGCLAERLRLQREREGIAFQPACLPVCLLQNGCFWPLSPKGAMRFFNREICYQFWLN